MTDPGPPVVAGLCGSLRDESKTRRAMRVALDAAADAGATTELVDLREYRLPCLYAVDGPVADAEALRATVDEADALLLGTPNYHGSYSGVLKNALDYCGRDEFAGTTVGLLEVAAGRFPGPALLHLRQVCRTLHAWTLPLAVAIPRSHSVVSQDGVEDADLEERLEQLGRDLARHADVPDDAGGAGTTAES